MTLDYIRSLLLDENFSCQNCKFGITKVIVGNGLTEPPYIEGILCEKFDLFLMSEDDFCTYFEEVEE